MLAASDADSLNPFIAPAGAEQVGCLRTAQEFLRERAGSVKPKEMLRFLRRALKAPPSAEDQLRSGICNLTTGC